MEQVFTATRSDLIQILTLMERIMDENPEDFGMDGMCPEERAIDKADFLLELLSDLNEEEERQCFGCGCNMDEQDEQFMLEPLGSQTVH